jgi:PKD repeat protein
MMRLGKILLLSVFITFIAFYNSFAQYCEATAENGNYEYISKVTIDDTTITSGSNLYSDYTDVVVDMYKGENYSLEFVNAQHDAPDEVACWIDWDHNEVFEANERIDLNYVGSPGEASPARGTIIPPDTAQTGNTRMRIMLVNEAPAPCLTFTYGEVEDYTLNVKEITEAPEVDFEADQTHIYTDEVVQFTDKTFLDPQSWQWSFSPSTVTYVDGTDQNSQNPKVRFEEAGNYDVALTATNVVGPADTTFKDYITVKAFNPPRNISADSEGAHVNLSWDKPNMPGYFDYEILDNADALIGATPERATLYDQEDFDYTYPVTIEKLRASFYEDYENNPWPDATFHFKIYAADGTTVLYESPEIEAMSYQNIVHELEEPLTLNEDFYLSVVPVDESGAPLSLSKVVNPENTHSYFIYEGEWVKLQDSDNAFELVNGIYISGSKNDVQEISYSKKIDSKSTRSELEDFDIAGYEIYRNSTLVKEINTPDSTFWIDDQLANGDYSYYLKAIYAPQGKSVCSDTVDVTVDNTAPEIQLLKGSNQILMNETFALDTNVMLNEHADMQFSIYNEGMNKLGIGDISIDHSAFSVTSAPADSVAGQDTVSFTIRFAPESDSVSLKKAHVSFETNDSNENPFEFSIKAVAGLDKWTWMVYLLEDETGLNGAKDINEWEVNGSVPQRANYLVFYDAQVDSMDGVYYVTKDPEGMNSEIKSPVVTKKFGTDPDMSSEETLEQFLMWTKDNYPAQHYGLTMWDHGSGIFKGDETTGITKNFVGGMKLWEMDTAVKAFKNTTGQNIDVIGFDVCLLGQFETAHQFRNTADYIIASELTEPGDGWDYIAGFDTLTTNPDVDPRTVAKTISETFVESYSEGGSQGATYSTQAVTSNIVMKEKFLSVFDSLANKLSYYMYDLKPLIEKARNQAYAAPNVQGGGEKNPNHRDLGDFLKYLTEHLEYPDDLINTAERALDAYNEMIVHSDYTGAINEDATGVKIWMPKEISNETYVKDYYLNPEIYLDISYTRWDEYLKMYEDPTYSTKPEVGFAAPDTVERGQTVALSNRSFFATKGFTWSISPDNLEFVDSTGKNSSEPKLKFTETGDYNITLSAENEYGSDDTTKKNAITVVKPDFNAPENLTASKNENTVALNWKSDLNAPVFEEGFENLSSFPPEGWTIKSNDNLEGNDLTEVAEDADTWGLCDSTTFTDQEGNPFPQFIHSGTYSAAIGFTAGSEGDPFNWLITPEIELRENETLTFWLWYASDSDYYTDFDVMIHADGEWTSLMHLTEGSGMNLYDKPIELSLADYANKTVKIAFVYQYTDGYQLAIDDITIDNSGGSNKSGENFDDRTNKPVRSTAIFKAAGKSDYGDKGLKASGEAYHVYRDGNQIATINDLKTMSYTDTLSENGDYKYYVTKAYTNPSGESEPSNKVSVTIDYFEEETGVKTLGNTNVSIYPNPSDGHFVMNFNRMVKDPVVTIFNTNGEQVYQRKYSSDNQVEVHAPGLNSGVYHLRVQSQSGFTNKQLIIQ